MSAVLGQLEPLPGGVYQGTMAVADIYPKTANGVIGGIRTQDRALPAYGDQVVAASQSAIAVGQLHKGLLGTPAGYLILGIVALIVLAHVYK
jgi:hypothetical protein